MEMTPGRAPFSEEEEYTPLRKPKSLTNTPTHSGSSGNCGGGYSLGTGSNQPGVARTVSPSKLSPFAKEFVPRFGSGAAASGGAEASTHYQSQPQQQNYKPYQQPQQRYANGYPQHVGYASQITSLTGSVQERLKIAGSGAASSSGVNNASGSVNANKPTANNYYQQQQQQQMQQPRQHNKQHHYNQSQHNNHQQQQQRYQHNHHNQQQHHQNHHNKHQQNHHRQQQQSSSADMETIALEYLQTVIQCLNQNPGQFDTVATRFLTIFDGMENNQYVLSNAMEDIFQESIQNSNFRYMGAKLYNLLHMLNLKTDSLFHTLLKCKLEYHQQEVLQYMHSNQQQKVRETALFLAELYMQLRGDDSRIHLIAENIVYSLKQLLSKESPDNVRCICLTLKLAGYDLTADCPIDMQEIIAQLDTINVQSPGKYTLAANVISLQKNNWGRKISSSNSLSDASDPVKPPEPLRCSDEPVFYGPDGRELTAEEAEFLSGDGATSGENDDEDGSGDYDVDFDPEMDEETERAYEEFCKLNAST